jgi:hypothetical protein
MDAGSHGDGYADVATNSRTVADTICHVTHAVDQSRRHGDGNGITYPRPLTAHLPPIRPGA